MFVAVAQVRLGRPDDAADFHHVCVVVIRRQRYPLRIRPETCWCGLMHTWHLNIPVGTLPT